jgi:Histidine phosphatase superfamily (branch 1)
MTRTIQTALLVFNSLLDSSPPKFEVQVWPGLREAHDANCNKGVGRADLASKFPQLDLSACCNEWDYAPHSLDEATMRAERVRQRLKALSSSFKNIFIITHRGFIAFLVKGDRFDVCGKAGSTIESFGTVLTYPCLQESRSSSFRGMRKLMRQDMVSIGIQG